MERHPFYKHIISSTLKSYSQVFFSENLILGGILFIVSFLDKGAGICGLLAVISTNTISYVIGYNKQLIFKGLYSFNSLLVGLGLGLYYTLSPELLLIIVFSAILTLFVTVVLKGVLIKYGLPYLSIPFLLGIWIVALASGEFESLGLSERGIYTGNEMYALGGKFLLEIYNGFEALGVPQSLQTYFLSLGAIFFQYNIISGILISVGLIIYSRIAFSLSLIGFYMAYLFYMLLGTDFSSLSYTYIGFNYILTSVAIGGYFYIPRKSTYLAITILLPMVILLTISLNKLMSGFALPIYSLPFNIVVLLFIFAMKFREHNKLGLEEAVYQHGSPEKNLYFSYNLFNRFKNAVYNPVYLPFWGEWSVSQGHNGEYTHKNEWNHAWDFVITDKDGKQYKGAGDLVTDYFCYGKNIIAPADGVVSEIVDTLDDNIIGQMDNEHNWGNTIIIKHTEYLYTQLSHIKKGSFKVRAGEHVFKGQIIAQVGNTGRSPYPHLHFQVQATPYIGSHTLDYPLSNYITIKESGFKYFAFHTPKTGDKISNPEQHELLANAFNFAPGRELAFDVRGNSAKSSSINGVHKLQIMSDMYKNTYFYCKNSDSYAYFHFNGSLIYFTDFVGDKQSFLFLFMLALYKAQTSFYKGLILGDNIPVNFLFKGAVKIFQDFSAPFFMFLKSKYSLNYEGVDDEFFPSEMILKSEITNKIFGKERKILDGTIKITSKGIAQLEIQLRGDKIKAQWQE